MKSYEVNKNQIDTNLEVFIDDFIDGLTSEIMVLPRGNYFIEYRDFDNAYESFKKNTEGFKKFEEQKILDLVIDKPMVFMVIRTIMGFTPPEWAHIAQTESGVDIPQGYVRSIEKRIREDILKPLTATPVLIDRLRAMIKTAILVIKKGARNTDPTMLHRMDKLDTREGFTSLSTTAKHHVPYSSLLYERLIGRPFASHRDAVSELVGDVMENAIANLLDEKGVTYHKTARAERIPGFDQAPDFVIPNIENPVIIIEAKITEDDGTARDKVTRIQHLREMSNSSKVPYEVVACIDGRGFGIRRDDVRKLLTATEGKLFSRSTLLNLVTSTKISQYVTK